MESSETIIIIPEFLSEYIRIYRGASFKGGSLQDMVERTIVKKAWSFLGRDLTIPLASS